MKLGEKKEKLSQVSAELFWKKEEAGYAALNLVFTVHLCISVFVLLSKTFFFKFHSTFLQICVAYCPQNFCSTEIQGKEIG